MADAPQFDPEHARALGGGLLGYFTLLALLPKLDWRIALTAFVCMAGVTVALVPIGAVLLGRWLELSDLAWLYTALGYISGIGSLFVLGWGISLAHKYQDDPKGFFRFLFRRNGKNGGSDASKP